MNTNAITVCSFIQKCKQKINFHHTQAALSREWDSILSTSSMVGSSLQAFLITVLTATDCPILSVTITSAAFAFLIGVLNKVKDNFSFRALSVQHENASDDFSSLLVEFNKLNKLEIIATIDLDLQINNYNLIMQKNHLQIVKECGYLFCCMKQKNIV